MLCLLSIPVVLIPVLILILFFLILLHFLLLMVFLSTQLSVKRQIFLSIQLPVKRQTRFFRPGQRRIVLLLDVQILLVLFALVVVVAVVVENLVEMWKLQNRTLEPEAGPSVLRSRKRS